MLPAHKIFDLGAFTIDPDGRILVSEQVHGATQFDEVLLRHHGLHVRGLQRMDYRPFEEYLGWHRTEVFKEKARFLEGIS